MLGKKTVRMNDSARDLMYEFSIEELMKNEQFKKKKYVGEKHYLGGKYLKLWKKIKNIQKFYLKK